LVVAVALVTDEVAAVAPADFKLVVCQLILAQEFLLLLVQAAQAEHLLVIQAQTVQVQYSVVSHH
jgi:hypothetical protein